MKISARNQLKGKVTSLETDQILAKVSVEISHSQVITAVITKEAAIDLGLTVGGEVNAMVKATSVMLVKE
ncbi:MAG: TOBE domain-containing protein [Bacillota bacterium]